MYVCNVVLRRLAGGGYFLVTCLLSLREPSQTVAESQETLNFWVNTQVSALTYVRIVYLCLFSASGGLARIAPSAF